MKPSAKTSNATASLHVSPEHKVKIVRAYKAHGNIVSMTGDGVNDAPSLKFADIGVAMGITGTDVSKGASDMILTDDNFTTIVRAIEEGRNIYNNIRKSVVFLLSCNLGEVLAIFLSVLFFWPLPLLPTQILWINLITDTLPALALGVDPGDHDVMKQKPRNPSESFCRRRRDTGYYRRHTHWHIDIISFPFRINRTRLQLKFEKHSHRCAHLCTDHVLRGVSSLAADLFADHAQLHKITVPNRYLLKQILDWRYHRRLYSAIWRHYHSAFGQCF